MLEGNYSLANNNNTPSIQLLALGAISSGQVGTQTLFVTGVGETQTGAIGGGNGTIAVVKNGTGGLVLNGNDTFTGGLTINAGFVGQLNAGALNSAGTNTVMFGAGSTGILALSDFNATISGLSSNGGSPIIEDGGSLDGPPVTLTVNSVQTTTFGGTIEDNGPKSLSLVKSGGGALILSGSNFYTGSTTINNFGTLQGGAANAFASTSAFNVAATGSLNLGGFSQSIGSLTGSGFVFTTGSSGSDTLNVGFDNTNTTFSGLMLDGGGRTLGLSKFGSGTLTLTGNNTSTGPINVNSGTLAQAGGTLVASLTNFATFVYNGGSYSGLFLTNYGTAIFNAPFISGCSFGSEGTAWAAASVDVTFNNSNFDNAGSFTMNGGSLTLSTNATNFNSGSLNLATSASLRLPSSTLLNTGFITLTGGSISGFGGTLTNAAGGTVFGTGTISSGFTNSGLVTVGSGALSILSSFNNAGVIQLTALDSALNGSTITSTGTIEGFGSVSSFSVANAANGTIEAIGGTLSLNGSLQNQAGGLLTASSGNKLLVTQGLATNSGTINLAGGTFDNNGHPLNNTGEISGWGIFRTGGTGLDNHGSMTFSGGVTTVNGPLTNESGMTITVAQNPAVFTGMVTNNGGATFNTVNATATFAGGFTNNGNSNFAVIGNGSIDVPVAAAFADGSSMSVGGSSKLKFDAVSGAASVGTGVTATVASGATLELAGAVSALSSGSEAPAPAGRVNVLNNSSTPGILVSGTNQQVGNIDGGGTTQVNAGSDLTANHIVQNALIIGGTAANPGLVTIDASDASGNPLGQSSNAALIASTTPGVPAEVGGMSTANVINATTGTADLANTTTGTSVGSNNPSPVPEPSTLALALLAILGVISTQLVRHDF